MQHFISIADHQADWLQHVLDVALELRQQRQLGQACQPRLTGKTIAMIFEKPSLRTRVSFDVAIQELGGHSIMLGAAEVGLGKREATVDAARVLGGMVHGIIARVFEHQKLIELAQHSHLPVINALSDESHPCQAMADVMTMIDEFGRDVVGRTVAYIGDGNNVALSLAYLCGKFDISFILASPAGYELNQAQIDRLCDHLPDMNFRIVRDPSQAVQHADVIYTDTWVSMGQEMDSAKRQAAFKGYQVNGQLLAKAPSHAIVLHCLPAHRNVEITDQVMDGPQSRIFVQAHNRLHAQKGLLAVLIGGA